MQEMMAQMRRAPGEMNKRREEFAGLLAQAVSVQSSAQSTAASTTLRSVVGPKFADRLEKFFGKPKDGLELQTVFVSKCSVLSLDDPTKQTRNVDEVDIEMGRLDDNAVLQAEGVYYMLTEKCRGQALNIVRGISESN